MSVVVFTGPTLSPEEASAELDALYLPPAAEGDVYRAARSRPQALGIIDGHFERQPAVWHKEILWAMTRGIHVFGAASMGALRAAELGAFGMEGVGSVFEAYRDGRLEDDDEVAVAQAGAELGFRALSDAMVDIRHTIRRAVEASVLSDGVAAALEDLAKKLFYPERTYQRVMRDARAAGLPTGELDAFAEWLPSGRASLKRQDAVAMLRTIRERVAAGLEPKEVRYAFESSSMWESAWRLAGEAGGSDPVLLDTVLDELRLDGENFRRVLDAAMIRALAVKQSQVEGLGQKTAQQALAENRLWRRHQVETPEDRRRWMEANQLDDVELRALIEDEARVGWMTAMATLDAKGYVLDELRVSGLYPRLIRRVREKQAALAAQGLDSPSLESVGISAPQLINWYFEDRLGRSTPPNINAYCSEMGFSSLAEFQASLLREFCFLHGSQAGVVTPG